MRLLAQSERMVRADYVRARAFAEWLLTVGEGRDDTIPLTELPVGMFLMKRYIH